MSASKIDRAAHGPSLLEVSLGAALSLALGVVCAAVFLILFKPVEKVKELPKETERVAGTVYYAEGVADAKKGKPWLRKRQMLLDAAPGEVVLTEEELNAWMSANAPAPKPDAAPKPPQPRTAANVKAPAPTPAPAAAAAAPESNDLITYSIPNFRIRDGQFQVGVESSINILSVTFPVIMQAQGVFAKRDDMIMFIPTTAYIGALPVHRIPGGIDFLIKRALSSGAIPEEVQAVLKKVSTVDVDKRAIRVVFP